MNLISSEIEKTYHPSIISEKNPSPHMKKAILISLFIILAGCGSWFYGVQKETMLQAVKTDLTVIVSLKVEQIAAWRKERLNDGTDLMNRPFLIDRLNQFLNNPKAGDQEKLLTELRFLQQNHNYSEVLLVDPAGHVCNIYGRQTDVHASCQAVLTTAVCQLHPIFSDFFFDGQNPAIPKISVVTPLFAASGQDQKFVGAIILISNASEVFYPLLQSWPTPSHSAETVLVMRDGDDVLFLNNLRQQCDTALTLRFPVSRTDLTAVMAVTGHKGIVEGVDYRGERVVSAILPVPGSPWVLVSKIDRTEAFSEWHFRSVLILCLLLSLFGIIGVFGLFSWEKERKNHYRLLYRSEAALRTIAERHSITLKAIGDAVISTDTMGCVELMNPVAEALTGWSSNEARKKPLEEVFRIINEQTRDTVESPVAKVLRENRVMGLANHTLLIARNGEERPITDSSAPIRNEQGEITGVVLVFRDQSQQKAYQRQISESEKKYRTLYQNIRDAIMVADTQRNIIDYNQAFADLFGYASEEIIGKQTLVIYKDKNEFDYLGKTISAHGIDSSNTTCTVTYRKKSGHLFSGETNYGYLRNDDGTVTGVIGLIRDITVRQAIESERERLMAAIEQIKETIVITDIEGTIQYVNPAFETVTGYDRQEVLGKNSRILQSGEHDAGFYGRMWETLGGGKSWEGRVVNKRKDGTLFTEEVTISPVWDASGKIMNYVAAKRDITKHLALAAQFQQIQKMESVGRLAGGVAHDYNNMLSVIIGYTELALHKAEQGQPLKADLKAIYKAAKRSADITQQLLAFARQQAIAPALIDLNENVAGLLQMLRRLIGEDIDVVWRPETNLGVVMIDPAQLNQILTNLCVNARDAIKGVGKIAIETRNAAFDAEYCADHAGFIPGKYVLLAISDDGCGMDKKTLDRIFEPFFTTKELGRGTGLGLATVYGIVKQNKGFIYVYSEPGNGTTIKIYLPRQVGQPAGAHTEVPSKIQRGRGETILVVEDEPSILDLTKTILDELGYTVLVASTPTEALRLSGEHRQSIDLLITDVVMPGMSGRDLAEQMHRLCPNLRYLFMSGYTADAITDRGVLDEGVHFIQKPFSIRDLAAKVRMVLNHINTCYFPIIFLVSTCAFSIPIEHSTMLY